MDFQKDIAQKILSICLVLFSVLSLRAQNEISCFVELLNDNEIMVVYLFDARTKENNTFVFQQKIPDYYLKQNNFTEIATIEAKVNFQDNPILLDFQDTLRLPLKSTKLAYKVKLKPKVNQLIAVQSIVKTNNFSLINPSNFLGYFTCCKNDSLSFTIKTKAKKTSFEAINTYQKIIDKPVCLNCLQANVKTKNIDVNIFFNQKIKDDSTLLVQYVQETFSALEKLPIDFTLKNKEIIILIDSLSKKSGAIAHQNTIVFHLNQFDKFLIQKTLIHEYIHWLAPELNNWLNESVAEYLALKLMLKSSLISETIFLEKLSAKMKKTDLYSKYSLFDLHRNKTNLSQTENYKSLYSKGCIYAFFFDLMIQNTTKNEIALENYIFNEKVDLPINIQLKLIENIVDFEQKHIKKNESISYNAYLSALGILFERNKLIAAKPKQNLKLMEKENKIFIKDFAQIEGLKNEDEILKLDGKKGITQIREKLASMSEKKSCFVIRRNQRKIKVKVSNEETVFIKKQFSLSFAENLTNTQKELWEKFKK